MSISLHLQHKQWLERRVVFFYMFKTNHCVQGLQCDQGINCSNWHTKDDRRRSPLRYSYKAQPCPNLYDYHDTKKFNHHPGCPAKDQCKWSHNYYESGYHTTTYKIESCPYLALTSAFNVYKVVECPFKRSQEWFIKHFGTNMIERISSNYVVLTNSIYLALDYCPFYHSTKEQRGAIIPDIMYADNMYVLSKRYRNITWNNITQSLSVNPCYE